MLGHFADDGTHNTAVEVQFGITLRAFSRDVIASDCHSRVSGQRQYRAIGHLEFLPGVARNLRHVADMHNISHVQFVAFAIRNHIAVAIIGQHLPGVGRKGPAGSISSANKHAIAQMTRIDVAV
jgi:hypothetical protein